MKLKLFDKVAKFFNDDKSSNRLVAACLTVSAIGFGVMVLDPVKRTSNDNDEPLDLDSFVESAGDRIIALSAMFYEGASDEEGFVRDDLGLCVLNDKREYDIVNDEGVVAPFDVAHHFLRTTTSEGVGYSEHCTVTNEGFGPSIKFKIGG